MPGSLDAVEQALATLAPLRDDPATMALGDALSGDAHLAAASIQRDAAPAFARQQASLALEAYQRAGAGAADAGVLAGRARALELLGDVAGAAGAIDQATALASSSLDLLVDRARLAQLGGDIARAAATANAAVDATAGWDPPLSTVRWMASPNADDDPFPDDRGLLGWSVGSIADHVGVSAAGGARGAGWRCRRDRSSDRGDRSGHRSAR